mmetsp:Transcript_25172/g.70371  ORF Transcript_25172/g.70371 Transcript_25172/m.70371 type:complete len:477 (+) Transcript_25172:528-1958(+)
MPPPGAPGVSPPGAEIPTEMVDVVIIGAGLSGLTAAIGLTLVGKTVKVIEADCAMEATGTVLGLSPTGTLCLEALGPDIYQLAKESRSMACVLSTWYTKDGTPVNRSETDMMDCIKLSQAYGPADAKGFACYNFHMLKTALVDHLPAGCIELGVRQESYTEDADGVNVYFNNRAPIRALLLIGADGAKSGIKKQCLGFQTPPVLSRVCWHGLLPVPPKVVKGCDNGEMSHLWIDRPHFGGVIRMNGPAGTIETAWKFACPVTPEVEARLAKIDGMESGEAKLQAQLKLCVDAMDGFDEEFVALVKNTDTSVFQQECMYMSPPSSVWGRGRVTLCGNAAHNVSIEAGVGPAMGLEDALALANAVRRWDTTPEALRCYEAQRVHRVTRVQVAMAAKSSLQCCSGGNRITAEKARLLSYIYSYRPHPLHPDADKDSGCSNSYLCCASGKHTGSSTPPICPKAKRCCYQERMETTVGPER